MKDFPNKFMTKVKWYSINQDLCLEMTEMEGESWKSEDGRQDRRMEMEMDEI